VSGDITAKEMTTLLNRAIELAPKFVPVEDRCPTPGGGSCLVIARGLLVAARALVEALNEEDAKRAKEKVG
jgi:hypothetical protein